MRDSDLSPSPTHYINTIPHTPPFISNYATVVPVGTVAASYTGSTGPIEWFDLLMEKLGLRGEFVTAYRTSSTDHSLVFQQSDG